MLQRTVTGLSVEFWGDQVRIDLFIYLNNINVYSSECNISPFIYFELRFYQD